MNLQETNVRYYILRRYTKDELNSMLNEKLNNQSRNFKNYKDKSLDFFMGAVVSTMTNTILEELTDGWVEDSPISEESLYEFVKGIFKNRIMDRYDELTNIKLQEQINRIQEMMGLLIETDDDQEYIDYLLGKISKKGMSSLSHPEISKLKQLSQGETEDRTLRIIDGEMYIGDVSIDRFNSPDYKKVLYPKSDDISDAYRTFFHEIKKLNIDSIEINNELHKFKVIDEMSGEHISIDDIIITPFWEEQKGISIIKSDGKEQFIKLDKIPTTKNEMNEFIDDFFKLILPKIV